MQLTTFLTHLPRLQAAAVAPAVTEVELLHLEHSVRNTLENIASYRLVSASPDQVYEFFFLLEAYSHDLSPKHRRERQRLAQQALALCQALAPPTYAGTVGGGVA